MSRRKKHSRPAAARNAAPEPSASFHPGGSGFEGANFSTKRGFIYFPTLETRREVDTFSRLELIKRSRWLRRNVGYPKLCINGLANMVGYLTPQALTGDREFNRRAEQLWKDRACNAETFDLSGRFNANSYQPLLTRSRLGDGDILSVFTEKYRGAAVMTYEAHQVANGDRVRDEADGWRDGVQTDRHGQALNYSIVEDFATGKSVDIPASACTLFADWESFGWRRGVTALHHAINHLLDITEITSDLKLGIKTASRVGYYEYQAPGTAAPTVAGLGDAVRQNLKAKTAPGGGKYLVEDAFSGGKIPQLDAGKELRQLLDQRPHPNSMAFLEHLNRDIAAGLEMSSDVLWNIAKLGGASVRYVLAAAQTTITRHQQLLVDQFLFRFWVYFLAKEMAAGRLPKCKDPRWWAVGFLPPAQLTVDIARDGKLSIDLHRAGMLTAKRWYGAQGLDGEEEDRERVEEYARRIALCAEVEERYRVEGKDIRIDPEKVFPTSVPGAAIAKPDRPGSEDDAPTGRFGDPEPFQQIIGRLDDLEARLAA